MSNLNIYMVTMATNVPQHSSTILTRS